MALYCADLCILAYYRVVLNRIWISGPLRATDDSWGYPLHTPSTKCWYNFRALYTPRVEISHPSSGRTWHTGTQAAPGIAARHRARVDTSTVKRLGSKGGALTPLRWTFVTSLPRFHLPVWSFHFDSPLGPLRSQRAGSTLHLSDWTNQSTPSHSDWHQSSTWLKLVQRELRLLLEPWGRGSSSSVVMPSWQIVPRELLGNILPPHREGRTWSQHRGRKQRDGEMGVLMTPLENLDTAVPEAGLIQTSPNS